MPIMTLSKRRTRFAKLQPGDYFEWDKRLYKKLDSEHASPMYPSPYLSVFSEYALVYRCIFTDKGEL